MTPFKLSGLLNDFLELFYPRLCFACNQRLMKHETFLCTECIYNLPKTNFHMMENNPVATQFIGKINFNAAASYYYFSKGGKVQHLIHQFKYKGFKEIGHYIGKSYGEDLREAPLFAGIDFIVPVPLHRSKELKRGYNQSECFATGLALSLGASVNSTSLERIYDSDTQTHKNRFARWENVKEIFRLNDDGSLRGKHILLVDDVITTGSTLEAAGHILMQIPGIKISVCSIACAIH